MRLTRFIDLNLKHYPFIILLSLCLSFSGLWFARKLGLDTDLKSLLPQNAESVKNSNIIGPKAGASNDMILMVYGGSPENRLVATDEFTKYLLSRPDIIRSARYRTPKDFFENHKYVFVPTDALDSLLQEVEKKRKEHSEVTDPLGLESVIEEENKTKAEIPPTSEADTEEKMKKAKDLLNRLDTMRPLYSSEDGKYLAIRVIPNAESLDMNKNRMLIKQMENLIEFFDFQRFDPEIKVDVYGSIYRQLKRYSAIVKDVSFGGWGILLIMLVVSIYFQTAWSLLVLVPPLLTGLFTGLSIVRFMEGRLNTIAVFLVLVVFGVGIEFGIHLFARYLQERKFNSLRESLLETWSSTGRATITSAAALLVGFALLTLSSFQGFAQFGRVAIVLLASTAGAFLIFTPAWLIATERFRSGRMWRPSLSDLIYERVNKPESPRAGIVAKALRLIFVFSLPILAVLCLSFLKFDYKFDEDVKLTDEPQSYWAIGKIFNERLKPSAIAVFHNMKEAASFLDYFRKNESKYPDIALMTGLSTFFPLDQETRIRKLQEIADSVDPNWIKKFDDPEIRRVMREIQERAYDYKPYSLDEVPVELKEPFMASDGSGDVMTYIFDIGGDTDGRKAMKFSASVSQFMDDSELAPLVSGPEIIFADVVRRVVSEGPWLVLGMFVLVFLSCWLDFRNIKDAIVTLVPVIYGFLMAGSVLASLGIKVNFYNMVALASLGSMVVDNSIHLYHRYLDFRSKSKDNPGRWASYSVIPSIVTCTITSILGYGGMLFASHGGVNSIGNVAVIGLFCCLLSAIVFLPAWLWRLK
ncbi:MAG: hypothetical protein COV44_04840 [Deltaproteobacteria bacterium CG11_big_fil_rev_8_21_14_0_20_45_16]|nr:MAG: hypothetical protein COV44_04840 [Deltaproteobacteria bacterium CG11_big_fil_rev_8_21_14_0_20_45_16]